MVSLAKPSDGFVFRNWKRLLLWAGLSVVIFFVLYLIVGKIQRGQWEVELTTDPITDAPSGIAKLNSTDTDGWGGYWSLSYQCVDGTPRFNLWTTFSEEQVELLVRFDDHKPIPLNYYYGSKNVKPANETGPNTKADTAVINQMRTSEHAVVRTAKGRTTKDMFFTTYGADIAMKKIDEQCRG